SGARILKHLICAEWWAANHGSPAFLRRSALQSQSVSHLLANSFLKSLSPAFFYESLQLFSALLLKLGMAASTGPVHIARFTKSCKSRIGSQQASQRNHRRTPSLTSALQGFSELFLLGKPVENRVNCSQRIFLFCQATAQFIQFHSHFARGKWNRRCGGDDLE